MRILYLCPDLGIPVLGRKGASVHVRELIGAFARAGHRVTLAAPTLTKSAADEPAKVRARVIHIPSDPAATTAVLAFKKFNERLGLQNSLPGELRRIICNEALYQGLKRRFRRQRPDFIYERASLYATAGGRLAEKFKVPHLVELNAPLAVEQSAYRATGFGELAAQAERWTLTHADTVIVISAALRKHVLALGVKPGRVCVMPNGVDPELFCPREVARGLQSLSEKHQNVPSSSFSSSSSSSKTFVKSRSRTRTTTRTSQHGGLFTQALRPAAREPNQRHPVLGFVGGLRPWHGVGILPQLLARLRKGHPDLRFVIAGDGQLRGELEHAFQARGLAKQVVFTGALRHEEIPAVIRQFDIALAPYPRHDHDFYFSPLKLFEYMACGVPVVAANLGQISEVVTDGKTGLLYPPGNLNELVARCERLLVNPGLCESIGRTAAKLVRRKFTWDHNAARVAQLARRLKRT